MVSFLAVIFELLFYIHRIDTRGDITKPNDDGSKPAICEISVERWMQAFENKTNLPGYYSRNFKAEYGRFYPNYTLLNRKWVIYSARYEKIHFIKFSVQMLCIHYWTID